jgi:hypothetical protein
MKPLIRRNIWAEGQEYRSQCPCGVRPELSSPARKLGSCFFNLCCGTFGTAATTGLLYQPKMTGDGDCGEIGGIKIGRGNRNVLGEKTCPSVTLSTTNPT